MSRTSIDLSGTELLEQAIVRREGRFANNGALVVSTGRRTGRSPLDRFIVKEPSTSDDIAWGNVNRPFDPDQFEELWDRVEGYLSECDCFVAHLHSGADNDHYLPIKITTDTAWHCLFAHNIFIQADNYNQAEKQEWEILNAAHFICVPKRDHTNSDAAVIINFARRRVLLAGMQYAGEMKKALFAVQNFLLPEKDILPLHCAANTNQDGDTCLLFGSAGSGKTSLSAAPDRILIGDDEHGWGRGVVFNLEGGCYAKCTDLNPDSEPQIWNAIQFGAILENVVIDDTTRAPDYSDRALSENSRCSYPLNHFGTIQQQKVNSEPSSIIFLVCDMTGILPAVALLSNEAAAYHFLSGYNALLTSSDIVENEKPKITFSPCFGAAFLPRRPIEYAELLIKRLEEFGTRVYMVNTGWTGGPVGTGQRYSLQITRQIVRAVQTGELESTATDHLANLNLEVPRTLEGLDPDLLNPRNSWQDKAAYDREETRLAGKFVDNFSRFDATVEITNAGPKPVDKL